jgi:hypothetical protein
MRSVAAALLLLAACGAKQPTVIDGSTAQAFEVTSQAARRDLPDADRLAYDRAIKNPPGKSFGDSEAEVAALARQVYDGMTARQVVDQ